MSPRWIFLCGISLIISSCTSSLVPVQNSVESSRKNYEQAKELLSIQKPERREARDPLLMVHYMPWLKAPPQSESYGHHWHMGGKVFDPYETLPDGRANIASHYYPLSGPYDSKDSSILQYQLALMKMAGIDGILFDWYGVEDILDYGEIHQATQEMVACLKKAGMKFAVCYEDQTIGKMIEAEHIQKDQALLKGQEVFAWLQDNWFADEAYLSHEGRPVLLCFGPQYFMNKQDWIQLFSVCDPAPFFVSLDNHAEQWADASFNWPPMWASSGGRLSMNQLVSYLNTYYSKHVDADFLLCSAWPGFHDIYKEAGVGNSYGYLDYADSYTFRLSMEAALDACPDIIQIATWNDYGEGTIIEPSIERGYRELEYLQDLRSSYNPSFVFRYSDLRIPLELLRASMIATEKMDSLESVDKVYDAIFLGDRNRMLSLIDEAGIMVDFSIKPILRNKQDKQSPASLPVYDTTGRRNIALGQKILVSSKIYDFIGSNAVDGDLLSYWEAAPNSWPNILTIELSGTHVLDVALLKLNPARIWERRVQNIEVQKSLDGKTYTVIHPATEYVFDPVQNQNTLVIPLNTEAKQLRFIFTANSAANGGQVAELEIYPGE